MRRSAEVARDMEQIQTQMQVLADEMNMQKNEFVGIKAAHATMHQASVDTNTATTTRFTEFGVPDCQTSSQRWAISDSTCHLQ